MLDLVFLKLLTVNFSVTFTKIYGPCPCLLMSAALRYRLPKRSLCAIQYFSLSSKQQPCCWRQFTDIAATCRLMTERPVSQLDHSVRSTDEGDTATSCWPHTSCTDDYVSLSLITGCGHVHLPATCCRPTQRAVSALDHAARSTRSQNSDLCSRSHSLLNLALFSIFSCFNQAHKLVGVVQLNS